MRAAASPHTIVRRARVVVLLFALVGVSATARAQAPAPPPGPPPLTRPSVPVLPGAPRMLVSVPLTVATPLATPVPIPTAIPTPAPRVFNCSCFTSNSGTEWAGTVMASDYAAARGAASGACLAYLTRTPQSVFIPPEQAGGPSTTSTGAPLAGPSGAGQPQPGPPGPPLATLQTSPSLTGQTFCNLCACN